MSKYKKCEECKIEYRSKSLRKRRERLLCHRCERKELTLVPAIDPQRSIKTMERKEKKKQEKDRLKQIKKIKKKKLKEKDEVPKIKGSKLKTVNNYHNYITTDEKRLLYKKYIQLGYDEQSASEKVNKVCNFLSELVSRLREKKLEEENVNLRFKEEWAKLVN